MIRRQLVPIYSIRQQQQQFCRRHITTLVLLDNNVVKQYCSTIRKEENKYRYSIGTTCPTTIYNINYNNRKPQEQYINTIESTIPFHTINNYARRIFYHSRWIEPVLENCCNSPWNRSRNMYPTMLLPSLSGSLSKRTMITKSMKKKQKQLEVEKNDTEKNIDSEIAIQTEVNESNFKGSTTNESSSITGSSTADSSTSVYEQQQQQQQQQSSSSSTKLIHPFRTPLNSPLILPNTIDILDYKDTNEPTLFDPSIDVLRRSMLESDTGSFDSITNRSSPSTSTTTIGYDYKELYDPAIHLPSSPKVWDTTVYEETTPLTNDLIALLAVTGRPMSIAEYMKSALQHPIHGYYTNANNNKGKHRTAVSGVDGQQIIDDFDIDDYGIDNNDETTNAATDTPTNTDTTIIGPAGDFITAPEITQMFGECIAIWFFANSTYNKNNNYIQNNYDEPMYQWVEFGPGKGTMIADIIQFTQQLITPQLKKVSLMSTNTKGKKQKHPATNIVGYGCKHIHLIETSYELRGVQKRTLIQRFENDPDITLIFDENDDDNNSNNNIDNLAILEQSFQESKQLLNSSEIINTSDKIQLDDNNKNLIEKTLNNEKNSEETTIKDKLKTSIQVHWHSTIIDFQLWQKRNSVSIPTFFVGQEFLDALPIYAFEKTIEGYWRERMVDVATTEDDEEEDNDTNNSNTDEKIKANEKQKIENSLVNKGKKPRLRIVLAPEPTPALRTLLHTDPDGFLMNKELDSNATVGNIVEVCPEAILLVQDVSKLLEKQGGAAVFIDYGSAQGSRDSIRGYTNHEQVHFLSKPGYVDITADVDFAALLHAVNNNRVNTTTTTSDNITNDSIQRIVHAFGPISQGQFLMLMGLRERALAYVEKDHVTDEEEENIYNAMMQLVAPEHMGERFKVLAITSTTIPTTNDTAYIDTMRDMIKPPPGFE